MPIVLLYKDDLLITAEYMEELLVKLDVLKYWKENGQHVNTKCEVM